MQKCAWTAFQWKLCFNFELFVCLFTKNFPKCFWLLSISKDQIQKINSIFQNFNLIFLKFLLICLLVYLTFLSVKLIVLVLSLHFSLIENTICELFECFIKHSFYCTCKTLYFHNLSYVFYLGKFVNFVQISHVYTKFAHVHF